jgi:hypothetical protein
MGEMLMGQVLLDPNWILNLDSKGVLEHRIGALAQVVDGGLAAHDFWLIDAGEVEVVKEQLEAAVDSGKRGFEVELVDLFGGEELVLPD